MQVFNAINTHEPTLKLVNDGVFEANTFQPDCIIAIGGGAEMDTAKAIWLKYEQPETTFEGLQMRFMDIRKR